METDPTSSLRRPAVSAAEIAQRTDGALQVRLRTEGHPSTGILWPSPLGRSAWVVVGDHGFCRVIESLAVHLAHVGVHTLWLDEPEDLGEEKGLCAALDFMAAHGAVELAVGGAGRHVSRTLNVLARRPAIRIGALLSPSFELVGPAWSGLTAPILIASTGGDPGVPALASRLPAASRLVFPGASRDLREVLGDLAAAWIPAFERALR